MKSDIADPIIISSSNRSSRSSSGGSSRGDGSSGGGGGSCSSSSSIVMYPFNNYILNKLRFVLSLYCISIKICISWVKTYPL